MTLTSREKRAVVDLCREVLRPHVDPEDFPRLVHEANVCATQVERALAERGMPFAVFAHKAHQWLDQHRRGWREPTAEPRRDHPWFGTVTARWT